MDMMDMLVHYSEPTALAFVNFSNAVYCMDGEATGSTNWSCVSCVKACPDCTVTYFVNSTEQAAGYVTASDDKIVAAFRGSEYVQNWINDADYFQVEYKPCSGCMVHGGFWKSWNAVRQPILSALARAHKTHPAAKVHVTGHSLGAAMAVLAAADAHLVLGLDVSSVYTFGLPRVGNTLFRDFFNKNIAQNHIRVTHWRDPVPHLPPMSFGFEHTGTEVFYNEPSDKYTVCDAPEEDPSCSDQFYFDLYLSDHSYYIRHKMDCI